MSILEKGDYENLIKDIKNNDKFLKLKEEEHHGTNRYDHCKKVSYLSYRVSKFLGLDYESTARAGLLHDFYYGERDDQDNSYLNHPKVSVKNSKAEFDITFKEEDMIRTHMFFKSFINKFAPFIKNKETVTLKETLPNYKEGWIICASDVLVSFSEWGIYKMSFSLSILLIFMLNMLTLNK